RCGLGENVARGWWCSGWGGELIRFILHRAEPINVADFGHDLLALGIPPSLVAQPPLATGPFLGVPLTCHGRCRGALYLARGPGKQPFGKQGLETVLPLRTWLEHGNLFEEARLLAQLRLLNQVAQAAAGSLDLPQILAVALRELDRHLPQYTCAVWLLENGQQRTVAAGQRQNPQAAEEHPSLVLSTSSIVPNERAGKLGLTPGLHLPLAQTRVAACLRDGQAQYVDLDRPDNGGRGVESDQPSAAVSTLSPFELDLRRRGARSFFAVPLRTGDQAVGVLHGICTRASGFTNEQIQLLYLVADLLGPAISNCQLFGRLRATCQELRDTQNQLIHTEKMRALGELASGMAHDFNNSLCGVLGFLELTLMDGTLGAGSRAHLELARTCALDAAQTVRRVQDFARKRRDSSVLQPVDLNDLVRQTVELTRHKWESLNRVR